MRIVDNPTVIDGIQVVNDGTEILHHLINGQTVLHWESGHSMHPILKDREYCRIEPCVGREEEVKVGDPVFCVLPYGENKYTMVHMVSCISDKCADGKRYYQISSTRGEIFGWTSELYGIAYGTDIFEAEHQEENEIAAETQN